MLSCIANARKSLSSCGGKRLVDFVSSYGHYRSFSNVYNAEDNWKKHWDLMKEMRERGTIGQTSMTIEAPVDTMGATAISNKENVTKESFRFRALIATMLSPQTRDAQTYAAFNNLEELVTTPTSPSDFTATNLLKIPIDIIEAACKPVSFYKTKAINIHKACERIVESNYRYGGKYNLDMAGIPLEYEDMLSYKGVGSKIAILTFSIAWGKDYGICVDTHVHRIANRLRWVRGVQKKNKNKNKNNGNVLEEEDIDIIDTDIDTTSAEKTRLELEKLLPREVWGHVNELLVGFGQTICSAKKPLCYACDLHDQCHWYIKKNRTV